MQRREEEALLAADAYRVAFEQQLAKNSSLIYELMKRSSWRKKTGIGGKTRTLTKQEEEVKYDQEEIICQVNTYKDEIVETLLSMVCILKALFTPDGSSFCQGTVVGFFPSKQNLIKKNLQKCRLTC